MKLRTRGGGGQKSRKFCERNKWMPPNSPTDPAVWRSQKCEHIRRFLSLQVGFVVATPRWETSLRRRPDLYSQRRASRGQPGYPFPNRTTGDGGRRQMSDPPSYWPLQGVTRCAVADGQVLQIEKSNWRSHSIDHCIGAVEPLAEIDIKFSCNWGLF